MRIFLMLTLGLTVLIGLCWMFFGNNPEKETQSIDERFEVEQKKINQFNQQHNFLTDTVNAELVGVYLELLLDRFPVEKATTRKKLKEAGVRLIPNYLKLIADYKNGVFDSDYLDLYKYEFTSITLENKVNTSFTSVFGLIGLELYGKLSSDAQKADNDILESLSNHEFRELNQIFLISIE